MTSEIKHIPPSDEVMELFKTFQRITEEMINTSGIRFVELCLQCNGEVQAIGYGRYFCLDCTWDNLPELKDRI